MKKAIVLIFVMVPVLLFLPKAHAIVTLPFSDDFESYAVELPPPSPWMVGEGGPGIVTTAHAHSGTKSVTPVNIYASSVLELGTNYTDFLQYEGWFYSYAGDGHGIIGFHEQFSNMLPVFNAIRFDQNGDAWFQSADRDTGFNIQIASGLTPTWHHVKVQLNFADLVGSVWLDGNLVLDSVPISPKDKVVYEWDGHSGEGPLSHIGFSHYYHGVVYFDDFSVSCSIEPFSLRSLAEVSGRDVGACVNFMELGDATYDKTLSREFSIITPENAMKFESIHPHNEGNEDDYNWNFADKVVRFAQNHCMKVRGHTLVWHEQLPSWLKNGDWDSDDPDKRTELLEIMESHIQTVMNRYKEDVDYWDVVNEAFSYDEESEKWTIRKKGEDGNPNIWYEGIGPEYLVKAFEFAHQTDPNAKLFYNDYGLEGPDQWQHDKFDALYDLLSVLIFGGVPIHGVGFQMHLDVDNPPNMAEVYEKFRRLNELGLKVHITEMDVEIKNYHQLPPEEQEEKLEKQAEIYRNMLQVVLCRENSKVFGMWGFTDGVTRKPWGAPLIFYDYDNDGDGYYDPKPAYEELLKVLTDPYGDSDADNLSNCFEIFVGLNPFDDDIDDDGLIDGYGSGEDINANGIVDPGETDPRNPDSDWDGVQDGTEKGSTMPEGMNTDMTRYIPDADPGTTTDPLNPDTDGDGLLDGEEDLNKNGRLDEGETSPDIFTLEIDIKPGNDPNSINPKSKGVIPVAILTTEEFDATTVDPLSVGFGPRGATESHGRGHIEDIDGDSDADLVLHFHTQDTGIQCGHTSASLIGETLSGQVIEGFDSINTVRCK